MRKKPNIKADIKEATDELKALMQSNLAAIADVMISAIVSRVARATDSTKLDAIVDVPHTGVAEYKTKLLDAMAVITADALAKARREVPKAKKIQLAGEDESIQLGEFENLPASIRKKVLKQSQLILDTQMADLDKTVFFQFSSSVDSTDSLSLLKKDLEDAADDYVRGASVNSAASASAAGLVNNARNAFFLDDDVQEQLDGFEFTNGDPVSPICQDLAGTVFSADDPNLNRYWPPLHWNCKSYILPILKGNLGNREIEKLKPTATAEKSIQFGEEKISCGCDHCMQFAEGSMVLQTIIVSKEKYKTLEAAKAAAQSVGGHTGKTDETETSFRFRQRDPNDFIDGSFRTKEIKPGVSMVFGKLKV